VTFTATVSAGSSADIVRIFRAMATASERLGARAFNCCRLCDEHPAE